MLIFITPSSARKRETMRQQLEQWLNRIWYGDRKPPWWLRALAPIYRLGFLLHRKIDIALRPPDLAGRAIVVVGNLTVGGSGKTPLVIRLCHVLGQAGLKPGVISRGYGRKMKKLVHVTADVDAEETGDEPLVIARRTGVPVVVAADRCAAAQALFAGGVDVVIADDGLQHHRLPRSLEICVVDGEREFGNGSLLPAGPLREPLQRLRDVDYVLINGDESPLARDDGRVRIQLSPGLLYALDGDESWRLSQFAGCRVNAVAGIANPQRFFRSLRQAGLQVTERAFADHHFFSANDFCGMEPGLPIIMTEKDAVKCRGMNLENAWYLSLEANLPSAWESELVEKLASQASAE
jgi:tetraacyldisaccharide 4'-kinase